ncbi:MAG: NAD(P)-dependent glycerol-3-phosphate dehydrogenase [Rhodobacteraceae bacterium]|nr:NAD(P)-dependent glycerol-3-phosphate dehydrogenase [Paracoccaceae bacterium]
MVTVAGAGAFGTALAIALARESGKITLFGRNQAGIEHMRAKRSNPHYLPDCRFPEDLAISNDPGVLAEAATVLLVVPTQHLRAFVLQHRKQLDGKTCVLCCKGIEKDSGLLPSSVAGEILADCKIAVLTGPGFAAEIARGLPTALTLAAKTDGAALQALLSTQTLRLYLSDDVIGAQLGGALKNVIAIACGITLGAGLGESARAAVMTRGYAEMLRLATEMGANATTLSGLSGLGDLALTSTSAQSRNFSFGFALGKGSGIADGPTIEGIATARATLTLAKRRGVDMPLTGIVTAVLEQTLTIRQAVDALLSRPLKPE